MYNISKYCFILLVVLFSNRSYAQETNSIGTAYHRISLEIRDTLYQFYVAKPSKNMKIVDDAVYYWFTPDTILQTVGGVQGRLLDGIFTKYYPNKNIALKETYIMGRKSGESRSWFPDGKLSSIVTWSAGKRNGSFKIYNANGLVIQYGKYKNDGLDGSIYTFSDGKMKKEKYKEGILQVKEIKKEGETDDIKEDSAQ